MNFVSVDKVVDIFYILEKSAATIEKLMQLQGKNFDMEFDIWT